MRILIHEIGFRKRCYKGEESSTILGLGDRGEDQFAKADGPVVYQLNAYEAAGQLVVEGEVSMRVQFCCSRCAAFFSATVRDMQFCVVRDVPENDEFVDLTEDLRESILLRFPAYPVCRDDCVGLCTQCGASLEAGPCLCRPPADDRWSALDALDAGDAKGTSSRMDVER